MGIAIRYAVGTGVVGLVSGSVFYIWSGDLEFAMWLAATPAGWVAIWACIAHGETLKKTLYLALGNKQRASQFPSETLRVAKVANNLKSKLDQVLTDGGTLTVLGGDGYSIYAPDYPWRQNIEELLDRGCTVVQYVVDPLPQADAAFRDISREYGEKFQYRQLGPPDSVSDAAGSRLLSSLMTFHPTLASSADGSKKALWIERYHPPKSTKAYDCVYYSPDDLEHNATLYFEMEKLMETAWKVACHPKNDIGFQNTVSTNA